MGDRMVCTFDGCTSAAKVKGLCARHYQQSWESRGTHGVCEAPECTAPSRGRSGLCARHQRRFQRNKTLDRFKAPRAGYTP